MTNNRATAKIRFSKLCAGGTDRGEIVLDKNGTVRLHTGDDLRNKLLRTADRVDRATLMYGATAFMGCAAIGAMLITRRKTVWGYLFLLLAGMVAFAGSGIRRVAKTAPRLFDTAFPQADVSADLSPEGGLTVTLGTTTLQFAPGEFDPAEASEFIATLRAG
ncbi:MAG: hypothetical protein H7Y38_09090 [Armatimonadetes bacterium]|nr:hypothetical protein [Armatimonadota bacterium]